MAKEGFETNLSPLALVTRTPIYAEDYADVIRASNYAASFTPPVYAADWTPPGDANTLESSPVLFDPLGGWVERYSGIPVVLSDDWPDLDFGVRANFAGGEGGEVRLLSDGVVVGTVAVSDADNGAEVLAGGFSVTAAGGAGPRLLSIEIRQTTGAAATNAVLRWRVFASPREPALLPDPSG